MQCVMQCMIVYEWHVWVFKLIFHLNLFYSSALGFFAFFRPCVLYGLALMICYALVLSTKTFCLDDPSLYHNFPVLISLWFFDSFIVGKHFKPSLICSCWILVLTFTLSINLKQIMKNLPKQMHLFYSCKRNKMHVASEKTSIKKIDKWIIEKKVFCIYFFGVK